jgi:hypothetical protein
MKILTFKPLLEELERKESPASVQGAICHDLTALAKSDLAVQKNSPAIRPVTEAISVAPLGVAKVAESPLFEMPKRESQPQAAIKANQANETDSLSQMLSTLSNSSRRPTILPQSRIGARREEVPSTVGLGMQAGNQTLSEANEQGQGKPGWYLPVNWSDDDDDGWAPASIKPPSTVPPTANSGPVYAADMYDTFISGGDKDLFEFRASLNLTPTSVLFPPNGDIKITYDTSKIKVWLTKDKSGGVFASGSLINFYDSSIQAQGYKSLYAEGIAGSASFKDSFIKAEAINLVFAVPANPAVDNVEVTVFEITNTGKYSGPKSGDNEYSFIQKNASNNMLGMISYNDPGEVVCLSFSNCMEMQGTVTPPVVQNEYYPYAYNQIPQLGEISIVTFDATRFAFGCDWRLRASDNQWEAIPGYQQYQWHNDTTGGKDITISADSHIYLSDGPGIYGDNIPSSALYKGYLQSLDFINSFSVQLYGEKYQVSNYQKWHSQIRVILNPNDSTKLIRGDSEDQLLGNGWIDIPLTPF